MEEPKAILIRLQLLKRMYYQFISNGINQNFRENLTKMEVIVSISYGLGKDLKSNRKSWKIAKGEAALIFQILKCITKEASSHG